MNKKLLVIVAATFVTGAAKPLPTLHVFTAADGSLTFQGETFVPRSLVSIFSSSLAGGLTATASAFFTVPVHLPRGAKVTGLRAYYKTATCIYLRVSEAGSKDPSAES